MTALLGFMKQPNDAPATYQYEDFRFNNESIYKAVKTFTTLKRTKNVAHHSSIILAHLQ